MAFHALTYKGVSVYAVGHYIPTSNDKHDSDSKRILAFKDGDKNAIKYFIQETQQIFMFMI